MSSQYEHVSEHRILIMASTSVMEKVFTQNMKLFFERRNLYLPNTSWLNALGANVYLHSDTVVAYDNTLEYTWLISGHHKGEAEETANAIVKVKDELKETLPPTNPF
jgi:hypothetical protein